MVIIVSVDYLSLVMLTFGMCKTILPSKPSPLSFPVPFITRTNGAAPSFWWESNTLFSCLIQGTYALLYGFPKGSQDNKMINEA